MSSSFSTRRALIPFLASGDQYLLRSSVGFLEREGGGGDEIRLTLWDIGVVEPQQLLAVERRESLKYSIANTTGTNCTDHFSLKVKRVSSDLCDVPLVVSDLVMCGHKVADKEEDRHQDVLCDRDDIGSGDLESGSTSLSSSNALLSPRQR